MQKELALKSRVLEPGMGVERQGDFRSGVLLDVTANCSVKLVGTTNHLSNVPGSLLTPWNVSVWRGGGGGGGNTSLSVISSVKSTRSYFWFNKILFYQWITRKVK